MFWHRTASAISSGYSIQSSVNDRIGIWWRTPVFSWPLIPHNNVCDAMCVCTFLIQIHTSQYIFGFVEFIIMAIIEWQVMVGHLHPLTQQIHSSYVCLIGGFSARSVQYGRALSMSGNFSLFFWICRTLWISANARLSHKWNESLTSTTIWYTSDKC